MNNDRKQLIPDLRFSEFVNDADWNVKELNKLFNVFRGGVFSKKDIDVNGKKNCIHYGELFTKYNETIFKIISRSNKTNAFTSKVGDVLMPSSDVTPTGLAKASALMVDDVILGGDMNILRPKVEINSIFVSYLLNYSQNEIIKLVSGTTVKHIYPSQIINLSLPITPNFFEQQKIASCLSSLDELITAQKEKLELLKNHKKGLMQNLFPQEGETVPKFRFPEFENNGEWEEKPLKNISEVIMGSSPSSVSYNEQNIGLPLLQGNADIKNRLSSPRIYTSEITKECQIGDILLSVRAPVGTVAKSLHNACIGRGISAIRTLNDNSQEYLYQWLVANESSWGKVSQGGTFDAVNSDDIRNFLVPVPKNKLEQQKIASCLSSLDDLISAQTAKIEKLQLHKKGLMQGLFPKSID